MNDHNTDMSPRTPSPSTGAPTPSLPPTRGELILVLGLGSLFCCWPAGLIAWIMGSSDLKKVREGRMSRSKIEALQVGRVSGMISVVLFAVMLAAAGISIHRLPGGIGEISERAKERLESFGKGALKDLDAHPLKPEQFIYAGLWVGEQGTALRIYQNGRADAVYESGSIKGKQTGAKVRISDDAISVGMFGISKTWRIDERPHLEDGKWKMTLEGEVFTKQWDPNNPGGEEQLVKRARNGRAET